MKLFPILTLGIMLICACSKNDLEQPEIVEPTQEDPVEVDGGEYEKLPYAIVVDASDVDIFQMTTFELVDSLSGDGGDFFSFFKYQTLDSLIWSIEGAKKSLHLIEHGNTSFRVQTKWGHHFYLPGEYKTHLKGYTKGTQVVDHSIVVNVSIPLDRDFLHFNWSEILEPSRANIGYVNSNTEDYLLSTVVNIENGVKSVALYTRYETNSIPTSKLPDLAKSTLIEYMNKMYGTARYTSSNSDIDAIYQSLFQTPLPDFEVSRVWSTHTTNMALLKDLRTHALSEGYLIHAEPIQQ